MIVADVIDDGGRGGALMEPVVDGAAGGNVGQREVDRRSAAGRAALADPAAAPPPTPTPPTGGGPSARRRPLRFLLVAVAALVVLVAGSVGTYAWALGHWFVGVDGKGDDEQVAVFRGLNVSVVGFDLYELDQDTGLALADLEPGRAQPRARRHHRRRPGRRRPHPRPPPRRAAAPLPAPGGDLRVRQHERTRGDTDADRSRGRHEPPAAGRRRRTGGHQRRPRPPDDVRPPHSGDPRDHDADPDDPVVRAGSELPGGELTS